MGNLLVSDCSFCGICFALAWLLALSYFIVRWLVIEVIIKKRHLMLFVSALGIQVGRSFFD